MIYTQSGAHAAGGKNIGLALGGGGPLGVVWEIGVLHALEDALEGLEFTDLHAYIGVSAGAWNAAFLANGINPARMRRIMVDDASASVRMSPAEMVQWSVRDLFKLWKLLPQAYCDTVVKFLKSPRSTSLLEILGTLSQALPPAIFDTRLAEKFTRDLFDKAGVADDFRALDQTLYVVATNLDTGEVVRFGSEGYDEIPISRAISASQAVPGLFPPVRIDDQYYIDGGLKKSFHASSLFDGGADMILCLNPLVPYDARRVDTSDGRRPKSLVEGGWRAIASQGVLQMAHTRLRLGLEQYKTQYPDRELILLEPDGGDETMFFSNVWSFERRREICEHGYQGTMRDLADKQKKLQLVLARYGVTIREDVVADCLTESGSGKAAKGAAMKRKRRRREMLAKRVA
jgi:predicted acylesterase/phospholipase RssA